MSYFDKIVQLQEKLEQTRKEMQEEFKRNLEDMFKEFFEHVPVVKKISWTQYTPYFNDGDPCVFRVYGPEFLSIWADGDHNDFDGDIDGEDGEFYGEDVAHQEEVNIYKDRIQGLNSLINSSEEFFLELFGDGSAVTVSRDGITVEEYEHD